MQAISKDATAIITEIEKRIKTERQFYHFNVDILHIQAVKEFIPRWVSPIPCPTGSSPRNITLSTSTWV